MTDERAAAALAGGLGLLERAITYTLGSLMLVPPEAMGRPTPCRDWDLRALLAHMDDSLVALHQAADVGLVDLEAFDDPRAADPVAALRNRACQLLGAWTSAGDQRLVSVAGFALTAGIVSGTGAIEVAVHGWDVARACGRHRPVPPALAEELLELSPLFVSAADRPGRFAPPVDVPPWSGPGDRLVAFLGRRSQPLCRWVGLR